MVDFVSNLFPYEFTGCVKWKANLKAKAKAEARGSLLSAKLKTSTVEYISLFLEVEKSFASLFYKYT